MSQQILSPIVGTDGIFLIAITHYLSGEDKTWTQGPWIPHFGSGAWNPCNGPGRWTLSVLEGVENKQKH